MDNSNKNWANCANQCKLFQIFRICPTKDGSKIDAFLTIVLFPQPHLANFFEHLTFGRNCVLKNQFWFRGCLTKFTPRTTPKRRKGKKCDMWPLHQCFYTCTRPPLPFPPNPPVCEDKSLLTTRLTVITTQKMHAMASFLYHSLSYPVVIPAFHFSSINFWKNR